MKHFIVMIFLCANFMSAKGQTTPSEAFQLQRLVNKSDSQIKALEKILENSRRDSKYLKKASRILDDLSSGINKSIKKYKGTKLYEKALVELQSQDDFNATYAGKKSVMKSAAHEKKKTNKEDARGNLEILKKFQEKTVKANQRDLKRQSDLKEVLSSAEPGFVPKIQAQAELENWQASTRISAQMTELISVMHTMREELRILRKQEDDSGALNTFMKGSELQNKKQRRTRKP